MERFQFLTGKIHPRLSLIEKQKEFCERYHILMMKLVRYGFGLALAVGLAVEGWAQAGAGKGVALSWEYAGYNELVKLQEQKAFVEILRRPETEALWKAGFQRIGREAAAKYSKGQTNPEMVRVLSAFANDLALYENRFELSAATNADWILAVRLPDERHAEWSTNLWRIASHARLGTPAARGTGWEAQGGETKYNLQVLREKGWTIVNGGYASADAQKGFVSALGNPAKGVLKLKADPASLSQILHNEELAHAPKIDLAVTPRGAGLRSEIKLNYPQDLGIKPETWRVPKDSIHEPLIAFSAVQGVQRFLKNIPYTQKLEMEKIPNQLFFWAQSITPFSLYAAGDVGNPKKVIDAFLKNALPDINQKLQNRALGHIEMNTNTYLLAWRGLPVIVPFLRPSEGADSSFLTTGLFPLGNPQPETIPAELLKQLNNKDLVLYDWEITEPRVRQWRTIWEARRLVGGMMVAGENALSEQWLAAIAPNLGNTITEATLVNNREIQVTRRSDSGFTALELVLLAHWLDGTDKPVMIQDALRRTRGATPQPGKPIPSNTAPQAREPKP